MKSLLAPESSSVSNGLDQAVLGCPSLAVARTGAERYRHLRFTLSSFRLPSSAVTTDSSGCCALSSASSRSAQSVNLAVSAPHAVSLSDIIINRVGLASISSGHAST